MDEQENNNKLMYKVIDYYCTFEYLLGYIDTDFPKDSATCFCPFHDNTNTKAAKFYKKEHNEQIFCFAENKLYKPHHLLTAEIVPFTVSHVFSAIWQNLSEDEKAIFAEDTRSAIITKDFTHYYDEYKKCKLDYFDLLNVLKDS